MIITSFALYLALGDLHLRLLDLLLDVLADIAGEVMVQFQPLRLFRGELGAGLLDLHD